MFRLLFNVIFREQQYILKDIDNFSMYVGVLISPYPDLLPDVVGRNR